MNIEPLSWHQKQALHRAYVTRKLPAHILGNDYSRKALCGAQRPRVTIEAQYRDNPANLCCKHCKRIADKTRS